MRKVSLLMVLAVAAFMSLGATGAMAAGKAGGKPAGCKHGKDGKCKPKDCKYGKDISGKCKPKPPECQYGTDKNGNCNPPPIVVVPGPTQGPCSLADLVLLEDLLKGTGALACVYLGDNAPNASADLDCPDALLALPIDNLVGACVYLPPADVDRHGAGVVAPQLPAVPGLPAVPAVPAVPALPDVNSGAAPQLPAVDGLTGGELQSIVSIVTGLLQLH
jgi:hypothetical protein